MAKKKVAELDAKTVRGVHPYDIPLAYDIAFEKGTDEEAKWIIKQLTKRCSHIGGGKYKLRDYSVYEPMCGSGRLLTRIMPHVKRVYGLDLSAKAVLYCRDQLEAVWHKAMKRTAVVDSEGHQTRPYKVEVGNVASPHDVSDLLGGVMPFGAFCTINSFRELPTDEAAHSFLQRVQVRLHPHGALIIGLHLIPTPEHRYVPAAPERYDNKRDVWTVRSTLHTVDIDLKARNEKVEFKLDVIDRSQSKRTLYIGTMDFRTYTRDQFLKLIDDAGFRVAEMHDFEYKRLKKLEDFQEDVLFTLEKK